MKAEFVIIGYENRRFCMSGINTRLKKLFDYQRIENDDKLQNVIDEVNSSGSKVKMLSDDELMMAAGGSEITGHIPGESDRISESGVVSCKSCGTTLIKKQGQKYCMKCHSFVDDNGYPIQV